MNPKVSVVIPTRNRLNKLQQAIAAVESQTFDDYEIIVVDDCSNDGTSAWLQTANHGAQIRTMDQQSGAAHARNCGIELARGEFVAFLDDDDIWEPSYLLEQIRNLESDINADLSYADHVEVDSLGHLSRPDTQPLLPYPSAFVRLLAESFIHTLSVVVCRRSAFQRFGYFDDSMDIVHDLDWYQRIVVGGGGIVHLAKTLVKRSVQGGLVLAYRKWYEEEHNAHTQAFAAHPLEMKHQRLIRAYRSLFFARVGLAKQDWSFGLIRFVAAMRESPYWTIRIGCRRLVRRMYFDRRVA